MNFFKIVFLLFSFFVFSACEDLSFTDEDFFSSGAKSIQGITTSHNESGIGNAALTEDSTEISEEETTFLSENLELSQDTIIQDKKVVLNMVTIKTFEYDLTIIADEFISNHSVIQNFPEGQKAREWKNGRSGGNVFITAKRAEGSLQLILNGENAGSVPRKREISKEERLKLSGANGANGRDAIYRRFCRSHTFIFLTNRSCWDECIVEPTRGRNGGNGRQGFPGFNGRHGGNSGSFHLKAYDLSDFRLIDVEKTPGLGSEGGKGSVGGKGGKKGKNGKDTKKLCKKKLPRPKKGSRGKRGVKGYDGQDGVRGNVCLESLIEGQESEILEVGMEIEKEPDVRLANIDPMKIVCSEQGDCHEKSLNPEDLLQTQLAQGLENEQQKGKVICY